MLDKLVTIQLDKERHLRFNLKAMIAFQHQTGKNILKGLSFKDLDLEEFAAFLWACLIHEDKELSYDDVLNMVDFSNLEAVIDALSVCFNQSLPETKEGNRPLARKSQHG